MELPKGFNTIDGDGRTYVRQLLKSLYGQKQAGQVWNHHLNNALRQVGLKQSADDECVWYQDKSIFYYYVDDGIFMGPDSGATDKAIEDVVRLRLDIEDKGNIDDYLVIIIKEQGNGKIKLTQPQIIDSIINDVNLPKNTAPRQNPTLSDMIIYREAAAPSLEDRYNYREVLGKLKFLKKSTRTDIAYATHQCA